MRPVFIIVYFLTAILLAACSPVSPISTVPATLPATRTAIPTSTPTLPPTFTATPSATPTNSPVVCAWNWAYGDTADLNYLTQQAFTNADIVGTITAQSKGETGGDECSYHEMNLSVTIIVYVADTTDLPALTGVAARIEEILQNQTAPYSNKPSLAEQYSSLTFKGVTDSASKDCLWDFKNQLCH